MNPPLPGFLKSLAPTLNHHGYLAVGGFVMLEDFGIPVPGETILIAAAIYAGAGQLNIVVVGLVAVSAAVLGDNVGYAIGRFGGRPLIERYGRYLFITAERLDKATAFFERQGPKIVAIARFIEGLRQANGIVAGLSEMPWPVFLTFNAIGAVLWVALWATVGDVAGSHVTAIYNGIGHYFVYVLIALVLLGTALVVHHVRRHRRALAAAARRAEVEGAPTGAVDGTSGRAG
ncbi:MAG TPA: DedA family protein [Acidimicrobiales bacterium]|nr:DedA family protein [Acidimicrobiales bacterium]